MKTVDDVLSGLAFSENGWGGLEAGAKENAQDQVKAQLAQFQAARTIAAPFLTDDGALALEALRDLTVNQSTWVPGARDAEEAAAAGFAREGQNSIVRHIERCIEIVKRGPPQVGVTEHEDQKSPQNIDIE